MESRDLVSVSRPIFASLGLEDLRSRDIEHCKEMVYQNFYNSNILFVVFAGKKQSKHGGKMPETWKFSGQKHGRPQKLFQGVISIFCLSSPSCWRYNANARSQIVLPFLHQNKNAPCYAGA